MGRQLALPLPGRWGGARSGAGRKLTGPRRGVAHRARGVLSPRFPVHVTLRVLPHVWNLRSARSFRVLRRALSAGVERFGMQVAEFSIQGNHLHLVVEAAHRQALTRGMQGLSLRIAKGLNRMMGRRGSVLDGRYHAHVLRSPREVRHAVAYVRRNHHVHSARAGRQPFVGPDPFSSVAADHGVALGAARTYLLRRAQVELGGLDPPSPRRG